jgi:hypothetical protein
MRGSANGLGDIATASLRPGCSDRKRPFFLIFHFVTAVYPACRSSWEGLRLPRLTRQHFKKFAGLFPAANFFHLSATRYLGRLITPLAKKIGVGTFLFHV